MSDQLEKRNAQTEQLKFLKRLRVVTPPPPHPAIIPTNYWEYITGIKSLGHGRIICTRTTCRKENKMVPRKAPLVYDHE